MAKNYIGQCITPRVGSEHITKVTVPAGGLRAGEVVIADTLDNKIVGNIEVFSATKPATANLGSKNVALIINDGFETLEDGRRPEGQPNYYHYEFREGDVAPAIFLDSHLVFNISADTITDGTAVEVGQFLYAVDGSHKLTAGSAIPEGTATGLKVVAKYNTPIGGQFGGGFAPSFICVAQ